MRRKQFEKLLIHDFTENVYHLPPHKHTYYEIAYIHKGCGINYTNSIGMNFCAGDIFLLAPDDLHFMELKKTSHITMIKFTESYFSCFQPGNMKCLHMEKPDDIMLNATFKEKKIQLNHSKKKILKNIVDNILIYNETEDIEQSAYMYFQIMAIFGLIRDNSEDYSDSITDSGRIAQVVHYIHNNIYFPSKLRVSAVSDRFHFSPNYFGAFFKRNMNISYKDYIMHYKYNLIQNRIKQGILNKSEIASEFGFTDTSHLIHFLKNTEKLNIKIPDTGNGI